jgi:hypothetical protein
MKPVTIVVVGLFAISALIRAQDSQAQSAPRAAETGKRMSETTTALPEIDSLWNYGDAPGTEKKFRELLPTAEASGNRS